VVASKVLAVAFFHENLYVQSFPAFGVERRGAPVMAFLRVDQNPIQLRVNIYEPDHIVVLDPTLIGAIDVTSGLNRMDGSSSIHTSLLRCLAISRVSGGLPSTPLLLPSGMA